MSTETIRSATRIRGFDDEEFDFQMLRSLGATGGGGATIGECLTITAHTQDGIPSSWVENFTTMADRVHEEAVKCSQAEHMVSARDLFCRASMYYRAAEYFEGLDSPHHDLLGHKSRESFQRACGLFSPAIRVISIPYDPLPMPGYYARCSEGDGRNKTLIAMGGFDSSGEELYFQCAHEALKRGFDVVFFDGPGQTGMMRLEPKVPFRPDYEVVLKAVLDEVLTWDTVDPERVALVGISFGGYLAPRGVAFEPRIRALIANSPVTDWGQYMRGFLGENPDSEPDFSSNDLPYIPDNVMSPRQKQMIVHAFRKFGVDTFHGFLERLKDYRLTPEMMSSISVPVLACMGDAEGSEPKRQCEEFSRSVSGPVTVHVFSQDWGADAHCQLNNIPRYGQVAYDWLDDVFAGKG
jgi:pimeloyl-ACP methyl ester carboxylesterase